MAVTDTHHDYPSFNIVWMLSPASRELERSKEDWSEEICVHGDFCRKLWIVIKDKAGLVANFKFRREGNALDMNVVDIDPLRARGICIGRPER